MYERQVNYGIRRARGRPHKARPEFSAIMDMVFTTPISGLSLFFVNFGFGEGRGKQGRTRGCCGEFTAEPPSNDHVCLWSKEVRRRPEY